MSGDWAVIRHRWHVRRCMTCRLRMRSGWIATPPRERYGDHFPTWAEAIAFATRGAR